MVVVVLGSLVLWRLLFMFGAARPVGVVDGRLRPCPTSPNCVCSQDSDAQHAIASLRFDGDADQAWQRLRQTIVGLARTRVISGDDRYLHVEFTTALMRFVDDVEFLLDPVGGVIHVRSASRVGHSDLGANRKRIEGIRKLFEAGLPSPSI